MYQFSYTSLLLYSVRRIRLSLRPHRAGFRALSQDGSGPAQSIPNMLRPRRYMRDSGPFHPVYQEYSSQPLGVWLRHLGRTPVALLMCVLPAAMPVILPQFVTPGNIAPVCHTPRITTFPRGTEGASDRRTDPHTHTTGLCIAPGVLWAWRRARALSYTAKEGFAARDCPHHRPSGWMPCLRARATALILYNPVCMPPKLMHRAIAVGSAIISERLVRCSVPHQPSPHTPTYFLSPLVVSSSSSPCLRRQPVGGT